MRKVLEKALKHVRYGQKPKDWNKEFEREHKLIDCFANDIKLKTKRLKN